MSSIEAGGAELPLVILTGASGGIGRAVFEEMAQDHIIVGTSTSEAGADSLNQFWQ